MEPARLTYREHAVPAALRPWLACTWERTGAGGPPVRVIPDGCVDVVWTQGAGTMVAGPNTTAFLVPVAPGARVAGVRMRPGAAAAVLGVSADRLRDGRPGLREVWGDDGARLSEALEAAADPRALLLGAVAARVARAPEPDPLVRAAVARLAADPSARVSRLASGLFVSERQLRRRFEAAVGYGPKLLARVVRLQRALAEARAGAALAEAAVGAGYADQAHFAGDCRALAGAPPTIVLGR
ncbi:MAG TPA: DUF6597 domain-containing transcriptional factor [Capillimicrobium sp.]|nr:DUF6597 domain-containing transcriptional factor [Capillimicrobium sp.]